MLKDKLTVELIFYISQNSKISLSKNFPISILLINVKCITNFTTTGFCFHNLSYKEAWIHTGLCSYVFLYPNLFFFFQYFFKISSLILLISSLPFIIPFGGNKHFFVERKEIHAWTKLQM